MNTDPLPQPTALPVDRALLWRIVRILVPVILGTALADFLFWERRFGLSVGVFFAGMGLLLLASLRQPPRPRLWVLVGLLAACSVQAAVAVSFSTVLAAALITVALAGEVFQAQLAGWWARFSEIVFGLCSGPARWAGFGEAVCESVGDLRSRDLRVAERAAVALKVLVPSALLVLLFGGILAAGNAMLREIIHQANDAAFRFWVSLNLTPLRFLWWGMVATIMLGLFHGTRAPEEGRWWTRLVPRFALPDVRLGQWQTGLALLAMNGLFCVVNTLDAVFLWLQSELPDGVNRADFVHEGVNNLIAAVVLSALVIAALFQQDDATVNNRWLKRLGHLWGLQNFVLLAGVFRRLQFYAEDYHLTEKRVYVVCFLALVAVGFGFLAWFVQKRRSFNWLLGHCAVAAFVLFFVLQFLDVAGWVARYNVDRWEERGRGPIDLKHLADLGPTAWPELIRVAETTSVANTESNAREWLRNQLRPLPADWREYQWRDVRGQRLIGDYLASHPEKRLK